MVRTIIYAGYFPFGEEIQVGVGGRTTGQGYSASSSVRQKFTGQQRDDETGIDYFIHRYYVSSQGRFTSPDPTLLSVHAVNPQSWNRYEYVLNNPLMYVDPLGLWELYYEDVKKTKKNRDGTETQVFDHRQLYVRKTKDGDNGASLAKQLGLRGKDAEKFAAQIGDGNNIRLAAQGGDVGRVFKAAEDGLTRQVKWDEGNHKDSGPGPQDCSYTACSIGFPNNDALRGQLTFSVQQADLLITGDPGASSVQESNLRLGDIVRWADANNKPKHFATFIFRDDADHPIVFSKSGEHGRFEYATTSSPQWSAYGYGTIRGINSGDTGYYHPH